MIAHSILSQELIDSHGARLGRVTILSASEPGNPTSNLLEATPADQTQWAEERYQLVEDKAYRVRYELVPGTRPEDHPFLRIDEVEPSAKPGQPDVFRGQLSTRNLSGRIRVGVVSASSNLRVGYLDFEVRTEKIDYRNGYRTMVSGVFEAGIGLLLNVFGASAQRITLTQALNPSSAGVRLELLRTFIESPEFRQALARVIAAPNAVVVPTLDRVRLNRGARISARLPGADWHAQPRSLIPTGHPMSRRLRTAPTWVPSPEHVDTIDTPENRFVKFVLETFADDIHTIEVAVRAFGGGERSTERLLRTIAGLRAQIQQPLSLAFFREVSQMTHLPYQSPALQRLPGYREILEVWGRYEASAALDWSGVEEFLGASQRPTDRLYEYWAVLSLLRAVSDVYGLPSTFASPIIEARGSGLVFNLKAGRGSALTSRVMTLTEEVYITFSYNSSFSCHPPNSSVAANRDGSWSRRLRPDVTLTFSTHPLNTPPSGVEPRRVRVLFDAKYRSLVLPEAESDGEPGGPDLTVRHDDVLTMHAYRDAIFSVAGSYVLYPGSETLLWREGESDLPGVGAIALNPDSSTCSHDLRAFLRRCGETVPHLLGV